MAIARNTFVPSALALVLAAGLPWSASAQQGGAQPGAAERQEGAAERGNGRRVVEGPPTTLGFKNVSVEEVIPFIVQVTGKVVMPQQTVLSKKITVLNDRPLPREQALDLVILALQQNRIAVVETDMIVTLREEGEVTRQDVPVIGPRESVLDRMDMGSMAEKVYQLKFNEAKKLGDVIKGALPDYAKLSVDETSNQLAIMGNISLLQRMERLIDALDRPAAGSVTTETFRLRYSDANAIKENIDELFGGGASGQTQPQQQQWQPWRRGGGGEEQAAGPSEIRVTANVAQNSVTVVAAPALMEEIRSQIVDQWDKPIAPEVLTPKVYDLRHSDPVKVAALLEGLFGSGTRTTTGGGGGAGGQQFQGQGQGQRQGNDGSPTTGQGAGRLAGQFTFQPIADASRLIVIAKSPDNIPVIDAIIAQIDQPQTAGLPEVIELKHASADDLAEQLNALLAQEGTLAQVRRAEEGLSANDLTTSPFAENTDGDQANQQVERGSISFWWQRARVPTDRRSASNLIGQIRVVPVWRQNAVMVVAPPEYQDSIVQLVNKLDRPGRQVLISAIVCEVSRDDATSLGLRWSSQAITPARGDNSVSLGVESRNTENNYATSLFDTSVLNVNADVNVLLQALNEKTGVSILSEPKIFTSDNQEATFFDGQDIPFVTDSQTNQQGNLVQSFDYRAVGIQLRARPRITVQGDVDLRVNLELSSIVSGQTLFGGFIVDRRETTTQLIVQNRQTVVISGILREEDTNIVRKVPLLGDIPLLGELFKSRDTVKSNTELLVFITPIVVNNTGEATPLNESFVERLRSLRDANQPKKSESKDPLLKDRLRPGDVPELEAPKDETWPAPKE
jgi:general secretion pathway protein D